MYKYNTRVKGPEKFSFLHVRSNNNKSNNSKPTYYKLSRTLV